MPPTMVATSPNLIRPVCSTFLSFGLSLHATLTYSVRVVLVLFVDKRVEQTPYETLLVLVRTLPVENSWTTEI